MDFVEIKEGRLFLCMGMDRSDDKGSILESVKIGDQRFFVRDLQERCTGLFDARLIPAPLADKIDLAFMGTGSGTEGVLALIRSFADLHQEYPDTRLYILGACRESESVEKKIRDLQLEESVFVVGRVENPSVITEGCRCVFTPSQLSEDGFSGILQAFMREILLTGGRQEV